MREDRKVGHNHNGSDNFILVDSFKVVIDTFAKDQAILKNWQVEYRKKYLAFNTNVIVTN